ncbi:MAG: threonine/serine exporter ThrE family protein [Moraxella sp.]|nr:threonine/serine exporter ThrE family protein [Moraxella sp.]
MSQICTIPYMSHAEQQRITRLCVRCALLLMQYGAESTVVVDLTKRLGLALGVSGVECALSFNAVTLTTLYNGNCITTARNTMHQGINVGVLVQIQHIVMASEDNHHHASRLKDTETAFDTISPSTYPSWLVVYFVGISCACFAYLNGGTFTIAIITFAAAALAMATRLLLVRHHFNPFIAVIITAFVATMLGALAYFMRLGDNADIAIAASVLLLVPSFPIINALSDVLKGYINMGVGRWMWATMLTLSACVGIVSALIVLGITHWGLV